MQHLQKTRGEGQLLLTRNPKRIPVLSERSESKDLSSDAAKRVDPEREPTDLLGFRPGCSTGQKDGNKCPRWPS